MNPMKKILTALTILSLLMLVGCATQEAPSAAAPTQAPSKVVEIADSADAGEPEEETTPETEDQEIEDQESEDEEIEDEQIEDEELKGAESTPETDIPSEEPVSVSASTATVREITMTAKNWEFDPSTIEVNKGDRVVLTITSVDVKHGFSIDDFGVAITLEPGKIVTTEFVADKAGTFDFYCSVYCGSGHRDMVGKLVVNE
ncbi:MAG: cupredoxin domain-containing protein [Candidatus Woesearchaeota archaeon]|nr:cupredoxin domain-containing protein [Candidatus Woesearchaeota archaeon]